MPGRLPTAADFPPNVILAITAPPSPAGSSSVGKPTNMLLLLHGLGDTHVSLQQLGEAMRLPETVCISIQAPTALPFDLGGFHWGDDIIFDEANHSHGSGLDPDSGFTKSTALLRDVVQRLREKCGYPLRDVLVFGFGQGGMVALRVVLELELGDGNDDGSQGLGGVVTIGGPLPRDAVVKETKSRTPVIVLGGSSESAVTDSEVARLKNAFDFVEHKKWRRPGDGAPRSRDEMLPIMQFFARRLQSRHGVPEGSVELT